MKICSVCNSKLDESSFYKNSFRNSLDPWCKNCRKLWSKNRRCKPCVIYSWYKKGAKERNLEFDLTKEQFESFQNQNCFYCGELLNRIALDRIDNTLGYLISNVRPCCMKCNYMKGQSTTEEFVKKCKQILINLHIL